MNPDLQQLQPYPFQRLRELFADLKPNPEYSAINLSIGEPKHATPALIVDALANNLDGLASYPTTLGSAKLRETISAWISRRYQLPPLNAETEIVPVNGSREALFAFAQTIIDRSRQQPVVISPNPFYQIYEARLSLQVPSPISSIPCLAMISPWPSLKCLKMCCNAPSWCMSARRAILPAR